MVLKEFVKEIIKNVAEKSGKEIIGRIFVQFGYQGINAAES